MTRGGATALLVWIALFSATRAAAEVPSPEAPHTASSDESPPPPVFDAFVTPPPSVVRVRHPTWGFLAPGVVVTALGIGLTAAFALEMHHAGECHELRGDCHETRLRAAYFGVPGIVQLAVGIPLLIRGALGETSEQRAADDKAHAAQAAADALSPVPIRERRRWLLGVSTGVAAPQLPLPTNGLATSFNVNAFFALDARLRTNGPFIPIDAQAGLRALFLRGAVTPYLYGRAGVMRLGCDVQCLEVIAHTGPGLEMTAGGGFTFAVEGGGGLLFLETDAGAWRSHPTGAVDLIAGYRL